MRNTKKNVGFTNMGSGFRTVASNIGQLIGRDFSPAVFNDQKMREADLSYYVGNKRTILMVAPKLESILDQLPSGKILFFHCKENSLKKEEICDFFNRVCTNVPFKIEPNDLYELGTIPYNRGIGIAGKKHTYYGFDLGPYESAPKSVEKKSVDLQTSIQDEFEKIKAKDEGLQSADVVVKFSKRSDLEKYFRRDKTGLNKLEDDKQYVVVFAHGDDMDEDGVSKLVNDINKKVNGGLKNGSYSDADVLNIGIIRKKFPGSGEFENYDVFAVKVG